jgi:hypothetical protein
MGSCHALQGLFEQAIASFTRFCKIALLDSLFHSIFLSHYDSTILFSRAIDLDPTQFDAWKRRGQTKMARGSFLAVFRENLYSTMFVIAYLYFLKE